ncbi:hypothetical protein [Mesorhizobium sp. B4-1-4]|uniref:hypothetical protein n=1 Tax=Mesorhizobium sp. B4-1-4 TaxID=2589888 RepID=UPI001D009152|nr:hypothetical protein [Mesorhizobium sp. B4-1-4]UCI32878.1 hypothetical protein FJW03_05370 [Mesorhizobium sp. B4-1-4]
MKLDLSPTSWGRVIAVTAAGTAFFIAVAFFVRSSLLELLDRPGRRHGRGVFGAGE